MSEFSGKTGNGFINFNRPFSHLPRCVLNERSMLLEGGIQTVALTLKGQGSFGYSVPLGFIAFAKPISL